MHLLWNIIQCILGSLLSIIFFNFCDFSSYYVNVKRRYYISKLVLCSLVSKIMC